MKKTLLFILLAILSIPSLNAQTYDDVQSWSWLRVQGTLDNPYLPEQLDERLLGSMEFHYRLNDNASSFQTMILRPMVGYKMDNNSTVWLGYAYIEADANGQRMSEHRMFQMISYGHKFDNKSIVFVGNTRLEHRSIEDSQQMAYRLRQMLRISVNLFDLQNKKLIAFAQNEYFLNLNKTDMISGFGFNQNRALVGLGYQTQVADVPISINLGYMNNLSSNGSMAHGVNLGVSITIPSNKKKSKRKFKRLMD